MSSRRIFIRYGIVIIFIITGLFVKSQDIFFSQFYSNSLYLNPAFAGSAAIPRISLHYQNQYHSFDNAFNTYSAAFDFPVKKLRGGLGFFIMNDSQAGNSYRSFQGDAAYSVVVRLSENYFLRGAVQAGYHEYSLDIDKLIFPDNVDINYGNHGISQEVAFLSDSKFSFLDFATGFLVYGNRYFGGIALHHLAEPRQSFYSSESNAGNLQRKYTAHLGAKLPVFFYGHQRKKFDISPQLVMQYQGSFGQVNYGLFATKWGLTAGAWFRQNFGLRYDAVILHFGIFKRNWQVTYTYDIAVSGLWGDSGGSSEISLVFLFRERDKGRYLPFYNFYEDEFGIQ